MHEKPEKVSETLVYNSEIVQQSSHTVLHNVSTQCSVQSSHTIIMKSIVFLFAILMVVILTVESYPMYQPVVQMPVLRVVRSADVDAARVQRQAGGEHHHDVVDFGAHTGHHGAFGWYADFPVHAHAN